MKLTFHLLNEINASNNSRWALTWVLIPRTPKICVDANHQYVHLVYVFAIHFQNYMNINVYQSELGWLT